MRETKYVVEYRDEITKKVTSRWHYDLTINKFGPILTEDLEEPLPKERKKRSKKKVVDQPES